MTAAAIEGASVATIDEIAMRWREGLLTDLVMLALLVWLPGMSIQAHSLRAVALVENLRIEFRVEMLI